MIPTEVGNVLDWGMDESGDPSQKMLVVSAISGQSSCLKKFAQRWRIDLARYDVKYFHARKHWNGRARCYNNISVRKRKELLAELAAA